MTPLSLVDAAHPYVDAANNIARLLQTLDTDNDPDTNITIDASSHAAAEGQSIVDWSDTAAFEARVATIFAGQNLVSAKQAAEHVSASLQAQNQHASLTLIGRFSEGQQLDEGMAEIVAFS